MGATLSFLKQAGFLKSGGSKILALTKQDWSHSRGECRKLFHLAVLYKRYGHGMKGHCFPPLTYYCNTFVVSFPENWLHVTHAVKTVSKVTQIQLRLMGVPILLQVFGHEPKYSANVKSKMMIVNGVKRLGFTEVNIIHPKGQINACTKFHSNSLNNWRWRKSQEESLGFIL